VAKRKKSGIQRTFARKKIYIGSFGHEAQESSKRISSFSPANQFGIRTLCYASVWRLFVEHHDAKLLGRQARHDFLSRQVLRVGVDLIGE
jgi:hypothetical protein